jgi:hypothetical protein
MLFFFVSDGASVILATVRVGWQDDIHSPDPEGKGESEQGPNAVQDGENTDYAPEQLLI